jgi:aminoglycoside N3'-acetyltransferase
MVQKLKLMGAYNLIDENLIYKNFKKIIKNDDEVIVLYSGLWSFINQLSFKKNIAKKILDIIEEVVTRNRTLVLPAFSSNIFLETGNFFLKKSIDNKNGIIPIEALKRKNYYRTPQPLHSYLIYGKKINEVKKLKLETSWGKTSVLEWISRNNGRICVMGIPWNYGCSYLHRFEEIHKVPWRYFKTYYGKMIVKDKIKVCHEKKYSAPENNILQYDFKPFTNFLKKKNIFIKSQSKFILESTTAHEINYHARKFFSRKNFWKIVKNKKEIKIWIKKNK